MNYITPIYALTALATYFYIIRHDDDIKGADSFYSASPQIAAVVLAMLFPVYWVLWVLDAGDKK